MKKQMKWRAVLALVVCLGASAPAGANMRAPIWKDTRPSAALKVAVPELIVEGEHLSVMLGRPYSGSSSELWNVQREAEIEAVYRVRAQKAAPAAFEFVMARTPSAVEVSINGKTVPATQSTAKPAESDNERRRPDESASAHFDGVMQEGVNELRVRYRQPVAMYETDYGYFKSSKWASAVAYELWPLHEWPLATDFRLQIEVSFADDTSGLRRALFGSRYAFEVLGYAGVEERPDAQCYRLGTARCAPGQEMGGDTVDSDGSTTRRIELGANFPARLVVIVRER